MLSENQIKDLLGTISDNLKSLGSVFKQKYTEKQKHDFTKIDWSKGYLEAVEFANDISVHAELGKFPEKLMIAKAPNETKEELDYRKAVFESITVPYWHRAENSTNRIWAHQNYVIDFNNDDATDYYTKEYPVYNNIISYFQSVVTKQKIRDPNAVLCLDFDLPVKETAEGEYVVDQSKEIQPYASIYKACDVLMFEIGDMALFMTDEKSVVEYSNKKQQVGYVLYLYDDTNIYRIEQTGKYTDYNFTYSVYYAHNLGTLPAWKLRGIPYEVYGDNPIYQSYFIGALPYLNKALKNDSTLDLSINKVAYPVRTYFASKCNAPGCKDGNIFKDGAMTACKSCGGSGKLPFSPLRDHIQAPPNALENDDVQLPFPSFAYVSPDTAILEFNKTKIQEDIAAGFAFINIDVTNEAQANGTEQTATEVRIDRDEFYSFLLTLSNELFSLFEDFVNAANKVRYNEEIKISVSAPKVFDLSTAAELAAELATPGLPEVALQQLTGDYLGMKFAQNSIITKKAEVIQLIDPYAYTKVTDMLALKSSGIITLSQFILHNEIKNYIDNALITDPEYLDKDIEVIRAELEAKANTKAAAMTARNDANSILNGIATGGAA